jgi:hypothetical protein
MDRSFNVIAQCPRPRAGFDRAPQDTTMWEWADQEARKMSSKSPALKSQAFGDMI